MAGAALRVGKNVGGVVYSALNRCLVVAGLACDAKKIQSIARRKLVLNERIDALYGSTQDQEYMRDRKREGNPGFRLVQLESLPGVPGEITRQMGDLRVGYDKLKEEETRYTARVEVITNRQKAISQKVHLVLYCLATYASLSIFRNVYNVWPLSNVFALDNGNITITGG